MVHNRTRKVPFYEWHTEKGYLRSFTPIIISYNPYQQSCLSKDNTIAFKGNFYTLPEGTYKNKDSAVLLGTEEDQLYIFIAWRKRSFAHMPFAKKKESSSAMQTTKVTKALK
jgi:hypothetical protein